MRCHPRAFATITAILLMTIVGVAVLSLTMLTASQAKRTRREVAGGQLRQVLLAATANVSVQLSAGTMFKPGDEVVLALPGQLADVKLITRIELAEGEMVVATMQAQNEFARSGQRVKFAREGGKWKLTGVEGR